MRSLFHPAMAEVRAEAILHALSDPCRAAIFAKITGEGFVETCSAVAALGRRTIPKSSLSNHLRVLREAGLIRCERRGVEMQNHSRCAEVDARFPGLLHAIIGAYARDDVRGDASDGGGPRGSSPPAERPASVAPRP